MQRRGDTYESDVRDRFAGAPFEEGAPRLPGRLCYPRKKKRRRMPSPLGTDAKNYNDEIPDPEADVAIPE